MHQNETGSFQELAHRSEVDFGQLSILTIKPGCTRGGHYHTRKNEWFCCIDGRCEMVMHDIRDHKERTVELSDERKEFIIVHPYESHTITNKGEVECKVLIIISEEYDAKDPDTLKFEGGD